jgi:NADPH-dependent 2,4-dienoyl-CoA reductase/sulfur reductase-like enzyme
MSPSTVLVVGAGLAGTRCAETLRAEGFAGRIMLAGEECVPPYERPALSKHLLTGARDAGDLWLRPDEFWDEQGIELELETRIVHLDLVTGLAIADDGRRFAWEALVLATGARARSLPGRLPAGAHLLRTLRDALALREELDTVERIAVVGAGLIGGEVATAAAALDLSVTVVDRNKTPLARMLGGEAGALLTERYAATGIELRTGVAIAGFDTGAGDRLRAIRLDDGTTLPCDLAVLGIGTEPVVPAPLGGNHLGIATDEYGATTLPHVYACGDATRWWSPRLGRFLHADHWTAAAAQGATVAQTLLGHRQPYHEPPYFWSDQLGLRLQCIGYPAEQRRTEVDFDGDSFSVRYLDEGGHLVAALLANRPREAATLRRELAAA